MLLRNAFFYTAGLCFLALAKVKHMLRGYASPKPFGMSEVDRCVTYDIKVVDEWLAYFERYTKGERSLNGKQVLELGPGSDLGAGMYLLSKGAYQYNACDVNSLVTSAPDKFYQRLYQRLQTIEPQTDVDFLQQQLDRLKAGQPSRLNYVVRDDFDLIAAFGKETMDIVFSQAAFEHFDDIEATVSRLTSVCKPSAIAVIEVDLKTHSRWISDKDPNNIYRYSEAIYSLFKFRGIPNRVRPCEYVDTFRRFGWQNVELTPISQQKNAENSYSGMDKQFSASKNQMDYLSIMICATKGTNG